ncbi:metal-sensitive transcriptional regulator [bacterium]|jgi:DNA-binding FrmR family transcriptional regulator|nr:metal-sensitive transcriptional regulator [bacterium]MDB0018647.1 metal-sensitive transcriptional regulator [bacterium]
MAGYTADKDALVKRLKRIEGQVRGLERMVEDDTYCIDVITQVSATTKALQAVALLLLEDHLGHCVAHALVEGGDVADDKIKEASEAVARLVKS